MSTATKTAGKKQKGTEKSEPYEVYALGLIDELVELENVGYCPTRAELRIPKTAIKAVKRLAVTLDAKEERLSDGTLVKNSVPRSIAWVLEKFAESI